MTSMSCVQSPSSVGAKKRPLPCSSVAAAPPHTSVAPLATASSTCPAPGGRADVNHQNASRPRCRSPAGSAACRQRGLAACSDLRLQEGQRGGLRQRADRRGGVRGVAHLILADELRRARHERVVVRGVLTQGNNAGGSVGRHARQARASVGSQGRARAGRNPHDTGPQGGEGEGGREGLADHVDALDAAARLSGVVEGAVHQALGRRRGVRVRCHVPRVLTAKLQRLQTRSPPAAATGGGKRAVSAGGGNREG